jgi:hypothetical protein
MNVDSITGLSRYHEDIKILRRKASVDNAREVASFILFMGGRSLHEFH